MCKYALHYDLLIYKYGSETKPDDGGYYERHHIIPKSLGGSNEPSNLVYMSGKAHYIAHYLLFKIHGVGPMATALWAMCALNKGNRHKATSRSFELARGSAAAHSSQIQIGVPKTEEQKASMRVPKSEQGRLNMKWTDKQKAALSAKMQGHEVTPETRAKMSATRKGMRYTDEHRANMSKAHKLRHKLKREMNNG